MAVRGKAKVEFWNLSPRDRLFPCQASEQKAAGRESPARSRGSSVPGPPRALQQLPGGCCCWSSPTAPPDPHHPPLTARMCSEQNQAVGASALGQLSTASPVPSGAAQGNLCPRGATGSLLQAHAARSPALMARGAKEAGAGSLGLLS